MIRIHFALLFLLLAQGCTDVCDTLDQLGTPPISFYLTDRSGVPLLDGRNPAYAPDSVRLLREGRQLLLSRQFDPQLDSYVFETQDYANNLSLTGTDLRLLLYLNRTDADTLDITYHYQRGRCFDMLVLDSFFFNRVRVFPAVGTRNRLTLVK